MNARRVPRRQGGFTLIELMIAIAIGMAIIASLAGILAATSGSSKTNDRTTELQFNGRYALNALKLELLQSGNRGYTWAEPSAAYTALTPTVTGDCGDGSGNFVANIRQGVWGVDDANPFSANCASAKSPASAGGDMLIIRRLDPPETTLVANKFYFQSTYAQGGVFRGSTDPLVINAAALPRGNFPIKVYVYYVRPWTVSSTESPKIPALVRVALQDNGTMATELVASGIEQMQVQYGRRTTAGNVQYYDSFTTTNCSTCVLEATNGLTTTQTVWDEVNSVRIWLLARSPTVEPGYTNNTTYAMGNISYAVNDSFRRQVFTTVVQLRN